MARTLDHVLQKKVESALFAVPDFHLETEKLETTVQAYIVVLQPVGRCARILFRDHLGRFPPNRCLKKLPENDDPTFEKILKMKISGSSSGALRRAECAEPAADPIANFTAQPRQDSGDWGPGNECS